MMILCTHVCAVCVLGVGCGVTGEAFFWKKYDSVGYKQLSHVQGALMVSHTDPSKRLGSGAMWAPQNEFWYGGPLTIVNYGDIGALRGCAEVCTRPINHRSVLHRTSGKL